MKKKVKKETVIDMIKNAIISPIENTESISKGIGDTKSTLILGGIMSGIMMIVHLFTVMIDAVMVQKCDFWTGTCKTVLDFNKLGSVDYLDAILKYLLLYAAFIAIVGIVYYVLALVFKKEVNYIDILKTVLIALVPFIASVMIVGPLLGLIYYPLHMFFLFAGSIYSFAIIAVDIEAKLNFKKKETFIFYIISAMTLIYILQYYMF